MKLGDVAGAPPEWNLIELQGELHCAIAAAGLEIGELKMRGVRDESR